MTERTRQPAACQYGSHTLFSFNHTRADFSSSKILHRQKKKNKENCFLKTSAKSQCVKVQVTENMRFPENKLVITRPWKASTVAPSSPPHPGAVFYWGAHACPCILSFARQTQMERGGVGPVWCWLDTGHPEKREPKPCLHGA